MDNSFMFYRTLYCSTTSKCSITETINLPPPPCFHFSLLFIPFALYALRPPVRLPFSHLARTIQFIVFLWTTAFHTLALNHTYLLIAFVDIFYFPVHLFVIFFFCYHTFTHSIVFFSPPPPKTIFPILSLSLHGFHSSGPGFLFHGIFWINFWYMLPVGAAYSSCVGCVHTRYLCRLLPRLLVDGHTPFE